MFIGCLCLQEASLPSVKAPLGGSKAMKLGSKAKDVDSFVDALKSEGERISTAAVDDKRALPVQEQVHTEPWVMVLFVLFCFIWCH